MGTTIELAIEGVQLDWSKNSMGIDHGVLFQEADRTRRVSDILDYDYFEENPDEDLAANEAAFARPLARVLPRLDLMGYTLEAARQEYLAAVQESIETASTDGEGTPHEVMDFEEFCRFACRRPLTGLDKTVDHDEKRKIALNFGYDNAELERLPVAMDHDFFWSEPSYLQATTCFLKAYSMLQVFGTDPANAEAEVLWQFGPIVEAGWVDVHSFQAGPSRAQRALIATEGSSDVHIVKRALELLRPDVADFFRFIDVSERHPFSGTGSLVKFAEGLVSIDVQNRIIFLLDNDAEGIDALRKINALSMPPNMRAMTLPQHDSFLSFAARGPEGVVASDINGRAAAIECYLDLEMPGYGPPEVLWSNYKREVQAWQGALEHKETYMRRFLDLTPDALGNGSYDTTKLECVLDALIAQATLLESSS